MDDSPSPVEIVRLGGLVQDGDAREGIVADTIAAPGNRISTAMIPAPERLAFWVDAVCSVMFEAEIEPEVDETFSGEIVNQPMGPLSLSFLEADGERILRTRRTIARDGTGDFQLLQPSGGDLIVERQTEEMIVPAGGCILVDGSRPFTIAHRSDVRLLSISMPLNWLKTWLPWPQEAAGRVWQKDVLNGGVLASALANFTPTIISSIGLPTSILCDQIGALVSVAAGNAGSNGGSGGSKLLDDLLYTMRMAQSDPLLSANVVARQHDISLRYLHLQFAAVGTTFGAELLELRLERAWTMLTAPGAGLQPINRVAADCGFANASHFARRFRRRYGASPTTVRNR